MSAVMEKIFMTPIGKGGGEAIKARADFAYELRNTQTLMRWSGISDGHISDGIKYMGFAYYAGDTGGTKMLAVYTILTVLPAGIGQRGRWEGRYTNKETVILGDLTCIIPWDEYISCSVNNEGELYQDKFPQGNATRNINSALLGKKLPVDLDKDKKYKFDNVGFVRSKNNSARASPKDRFEMIVKANLTHAIPDIKFIHNATIRLTDGKTRKPDFHVQLENYTLIIEYDEKNHTDRDANDEVLRMTQLRDYFRPDKTVFIRYGNGNKSWSDGTLFLNTVRYYTREEFQKTIKKDTAVYIGYAPSYELPEWDVVTKA